MFTLCLSVTDDLSVTLENVLDVVQVVTQITARSSEQRKNSDKKQFAAAHHNETEEKEIALSHKSISDAQQHKVCLFVV